VASSAAGLGWGGCLQEERQTLRGIFSAALDLGILQSPAAGGAGFCVGRLVAAAAVSDSVPVGGAAVVVGAVGVFVLERLGGNWMVNADR